jgi:hypothetical protein
MFSDPGFRHSHDLRQAPGIVFSVKTLHQFRNFALFGKIYDRIELFDGIIAVVQGHRHWFEAKFDH